MTTRSRPSSARSAWSARGRQAATARLVSALALIVAASAAAIAVEPDEVLSDARLEARARDLSAELRCLVCQNQSIDDSNAPLARDLRLLVRERLKAGDSDDQVRSFLVARYGDFVLLKPPFHVGTLLLWLAPLLALLGGVALVWRNLRPARAPAGSAPSISAQKLTPEEEARLARLLRDGQG